MASYQEKNALQDDEIIDLVDVIEEGYDADSAGRMKHKPRERVPGEDLEDDFGDLFEDLGAEEDVQAAEDSDLKALFDDEGDIQTGYAEPEEKYSGPGENEDEKPHPAIIDLAEQLESLSDRMEAFEKRIERIEQGFSDQVIKALEEKGAEAAFFTRMLENIREDFDSSIAKNLESFSRHRENLVKEDIRAGLQEALEENGLESRLIREVTEKTVEQTRDMVDEKVSIALKSIQSLEDQDIGGKVQILESKMQDLVIPDAEEIKGDLRSEFLKTLEDRLSSLPHPSDPEDLKQEIKVALEDRIQNLTDYWQGEKDALTSDLEKVLMFRETIQEIMAGLSRDMDQLKDMQARPDPGLSRELESLKEQAVSGRDLDAMVSRLRLELEEYILKRVPEAAARVIREEIAAIVGEKKH